MKIKFLKNNEEYNFIDYNLQNDLITIIGTDIPSVDGGFVIIDDENYNIDFSNYNVIYDSGENYIVFTSDNKIYNTLFVCDPETNYVLYEVFTDKDDIENGVIFRSGKGKAFKHPEFTPLIDENGFYKYKRNGDKIIETSDEERQNFINNKKAKDFKILKEMKIDELQHDCKSSITQGIELNGSNYSYTTEDQNNLNSALNLAIETGLSVTYHADGESFKLYSKDELREIYIAEELNILHHTIYFNQLKEYIKTLTTEEEVENIIYGETNLTGSYLVTYQMLMLQSKNVLEASKK